MGENLRCSYVLLVAKKSALSLASRDIVCLVLVSCQLMGVTTENSNCLRGIFVIVVQIWIVFDL